jgi:hypothetical protein
VAKNTPFDQNADDITGIYKRKLYNNNALYKLRLYDITRGNEIVLLGGMEDFSDAYNSNWNDDDVYGKQDPMAIFANTRRQLSFSCVLPANSHIEARIILSKCQFIAQGMYPDYQRINGIKLLKTAPLWKIKWGNLITGGKQDYGTAKSAGLTCRIDSFTYTPDLEANISTMQGLAPMVTRVSFSLTPFHTHTAGTTNKRRVRHFPYNSRYAPKGSTGTLTDAKHGDSPLSDSYAANEEVRTGGIRIFHITEGKNKRYYAWSEAGGGKLMTDSKEITPKLAKQLIANGYKLTTEDPGIGFTTDGVEQKVGTTRRIPASTLEQSEEGRKVIKAMRDHALEKIQEQRDSK